MNRYMGDVSWEWKCCQSFSNAHKTTNDVKFKFCVSNVYWHCNMTQFSKVIRTSQSKVPFGVKCPFSLAIRVLIYSWHRWIQFHVSCCYQVTAIDPIHILHHFSRQTYFDCLKCFEWTKFLNLESECVYRLFPFWQIIYRKQL